MALYFPAEGEETVPKPAMGWASFATLTVMALATLILGIFPGFLNDLIAGLSLG